MTVRELFGDKTQRTGDTEIRVPDDTFRSDIVTDPIVIPNGIVIDPEDGRSDRSRDQCRTKEVQQPWVSLLTAEQPHSEPAENENTVCPGQEPGEHRRTGCNPEPLRCPT